jgi:hypothetical protein
MNCSVYVNHSPKGVQMKSFLKKYLPYVISVTAFFVGAGGAVSYADSATSNSGSETSSSASSQTTATANSATAAAACKSGTVNRVETVCEWRVYSKTPIHNTTGPWYDCSGFYSSPSAGPVTCDIGTSTTKTATTSVIGTDVVGIGALSEEVGYAVSHTTSVDGSKTYEVPARKSGWEQWAPTFHNRFSVAQREWTCLKYESHPRVVDGPSSPTEPMVETCSPDNAYLYAQTEQYNAPAFRLVYM